MGASADTIFLDSRPAHVPSNTGPQPFFAATPAPSYPRPYTCLCAAMAVAQHALALAELAVRGQDLILSQEICTPPFHTDVFSPNDGADHVSGTGEVLRYLV